MFKNFLQKYKFKKFIKSFKANVAVYKRENIYILHSNKLSTHGVWISTEPCISTGIDTTPEELGKLVKDLFEYCHGTTEHPDNPIRSFDFVLKKTKVRSYKQFMNNCTYCGVYLIGSNVVFSPYINNGSRGFSGTSGMDEKIEEESSNALYGETLLKCMTKCK